VLFCFYLLPVAEIIMPLYRSFKSLLATSLGLAVAHASSSTNLTTLYGPGLSAEAEIFYPSDSDWSEEVTQRWNLNGAPTYFGAIKPATEEDVQHIVRISVENDIDFLATGRGHGSTSTLAFLNGIEIDLSNFRSIDVDAENNRLTVGGSVNFSQLFDPLYDAGKMLRMFSSLVYAP
jgi:fumiquinazoline A oxidase